MTVYGAFNNAVSAMRAQSDALSNIGINIANVNTGGYKRVDTNFQSILSDKLFQQSDMSGVQPTRYNRFDSEGNVIASNSGMDIAIGGQGFFSVANKVSGGDVSYTRDGALQMKITGSTTSTDQNGNTVNQSIGFLADKNGDFLLGWPADNNGVVSTSGLPQTMRIDNGAFADAAQQTTSATLRMNLPSSANVGDTFNYQAGMYDTGGNTQSLQMNWKKTASNTWSLTTTHDSTPLPQIDTVTIAGTVEPNDTYSVDINGQTVTYTVQPTDATLSDVRDGLVSAINNAGNVNTIVSAAAGTNPGDLTITGVKTGPGQSFTSTYSATNGATPVKQVDTVTLDAPPAPGQQYTFNINGSPYTYTVQPTDTTLATLRNSIVSGINGFTTALTAAAGGTDGELTLTAATAGTPFTTTTTPPVGFQANLVNTTANVTSTADNTATGSTTQSAAYTSVTSAATTVTFDGTGAIQSPTTYDFSGTWPNGKTTAMTFDFSGLTQYSSGSLFVSSYSNNGHPAGTLQGIEFDKQGNIVGHFNNGRSRTLYQLALTRFENPNGLDQKNGNQFQETTQSGPGTFFAAGTDGTSILPYSHELSNVNIGQEFTKIVMTQNAYNMSAQVFKTVDELTTTARDLKT